MAGYSQSDRIGGYCSNAWLIDGGMVGGNNEVRPHRHSFAWTGEAPSRHYIALAVKGTIDSVTGRLHGHLGVILSVQEDVGRSFLSE